MTSTSKRPLPRMPWYPSSFYASTRTWPFMARAAYRELLDISWDCDGIPAAPERLRNLLGISDVDWGEIWELVGPKFQPGADGLLRNRRLEEHRADAIELSKTNSSNAIKGWKKRRAGAGGAKSRKRGAS